MSNTIVCLANIAQGDYMKQIEMLVTFDDKGVSHPFRFRLESEDESLVVVNIDKILFQEENKRDSIIKYRCECVIQDRKRPVDIYYYKNDMKWYLSI